MNMYRIFVSFIIIMSSYHLVEASNSTDCYEITFNNGKQAYTENYTEADEKVTLSSFAGKYVIQKKAIKSINKIQRYKYLLARADYLIKANESEEAFDCIFEAIELSSQEDDIPVELLDFYNSVVEQKEGKEGEYVSRRQAEIDAYVDSYDGGFNYQAPHPALQ